MWQLPANQPRPLVCQAWTLLVMLFCYLQKFIGEPYGASLHRTEQFCTCFYSTDAFPTHPHRTFTSLVNIARVQEVSYRRNYNSRGQRPTFRHCCCICVMPVEQTTAKWQPVWLLNQVYLACRAQSDVKVNTPFHLQKVILEHSFWDCKTMHVSIRSPRPVVKVLLGLQGNVFPFCLILSKELISDLHPRETCQLHNSWILCNEPLSVSSSASVLLSVTGMWI